MRMPETAPRRFLAALTDSSPAFKPGLITHSSGSGAGRIRRFLAALFDSTPAFSPSVPRDGPTINAGVARRLVNAIADSSPAFFSGFDGYPLTGEDQDQDEPLAPENTSLRPELADFTTAFEVLPHQDRLNARTWLSERLLLALHDLLDLTMFGRSALELMSRETMSNRGWREEVRRLHSSLSAVLDNLEKLDEQFSDSGIWNVLKPLQSLAGRLHWFIEAADPDPRMIHFTASETLQVITAATEVRDSLVRELGQDAFRSASKTAETFAIALGQDSSRYDFIEADYLSGVHGVADGQQASEWPGAVGDELHAFSDELVDAVRRLIASISDFSDLDLSGVQLESVPMEGVLWNTKTRWPAGREKDIEVHSVKLQGVERFVISRPL
jgi:hypothetical protein